MSPVHSHGGSECIVKVLSGEAKELMFDNPMATGNHGPLNLQRESVVYPGQVTDIDDGHAVHALGSNGNRLVTLHLYIPGYTHAWVYDDVDNAGKNHRSPFSFDSDS